MLGGCKTCWGGGGARMKLGGAHPPENPPVGQIKYECWPLGLCIDHPTLTLMTSIKVSQVQMLKHLKNFLCCR